MSARLGGLKANALDILMNGVTMKGGVPRPITIRLPDPGEEVDVEPPGDVVGVAVHATTTVATRASLMPGRRRDGCPTPRILR